MPTLRNLTSSRPGASRPPSTNGSNIIPRPSVDNPAERPSAGGARAHDGPAGGAAAGTSSSAFTTAWTSPVLNTFNSLRSRITSPLISSNNATPVPGGTSPAPEGSVVPTPPGYEHSTPGGRRGSTSRRDEGRMDEMQKERERYPSRLNSRRNSRKTSVERERSRSRETVKGKENAVADAGQLRPTGFDARGYPVRSPRKGEGSTSAAVSPIKSPRKSTSTAPNGHGHAYPPTHALERTISDEVVGIFGVGSAPEAESSRRSSYSSLAPSYHTHAGASTSQSHLLHPTTSRYDPYSPAGGSSVFAAYGGPEPGPSRPPSVWSGMSVDMNPSPNPSFQSDAGFGMRDGWGQSRKGKESSITPPSGKYGNGADESMISLATLDTRLTMGREVNAPGLFGLGGRYSLPIDPAEFALLGDEPDDELHMPSKGDYAKYRPGWAATLKEMFSPRGLGNMGCIMFLFLVLVSLFGVYPILHSVFADYLASKQHSPSGYNMGGINATGQIPNIPGHFGLIDPDTPQSAMTHASFETGETWDLVFSDEFNVDGRTFYDGDDAFWMAQDLHYWGTNNLEWYDPKQVETKDGHMVITLDKEPSHNLNYTGGMVTTWNKFCFSGGYLEVSLSLPGRSDVWGAWPAVWTLGNLGRAGYGGTLDGLWPYSYNECDVGTLKNQSLNGLPEVAFTDGAPAYDGTLSYLPGQRLSRCTCPSDDTHPGPKNPDGTWMGRSAPEIDVLEAQVDSETAIGHVSQSAQWAPFNPHYEFINNSQTYTIYDDDMVHLNPYQGGIYQQATSGLALTDQNCYEDNTGCNSIYGFEYATGDNGYITWVNDGKLSWTLREGAMGPNADAEVGNRHIPDEPMYIIMNLGISTNFGPVDYEGLEPLWPLHMTIDYVRVYQDPNKITIGCDNPLPTSNYIARFPQAYGNANIVCPHDPSVQEGLLREFGLDV